MVTYDIAKASHYTGKDGERAFDTWCKRLGIASDQFPFTVNTYRYSRKGDTIIYRVVSWGCYINMDGVWVIFIAYRAAATNATIQYSWKADHKGFPIGNPNKMEFVN